VFLLASDTKPTATLSGPPAGQLSDLVTPEVQAHMEELTGRNAPMVEIPQAYHHIPLDQPLALIAAIRAILADWDHSIDKKQLRDLTT
jgi:pimeloyl-ACP methyl ester carboxylesterase